MKKTLLILTITTISLANTFARDISEKRNLVGFTAGFTMNTMGLQKDSDFDNSKNTIKPGGVFGFNYEYRAPKVFGFEIGLNYANRGTQQKFESDLLNKRSFFRLNFHSIELPVTAKFYIGKKKVFNFNVGGFASYALNVQSRTKIDFKNNPPADVDDRQNNVLKDNNDEDANGNRPYRAYDAGVTAGFEFISKSGFGVGAKVQQGLVDFTNSKYKPTFPLLPLDDKKVFHTNAIIYAIFKI
ncbi:MAG TPA: porin family protein [Chitinophagales bacterium]|nr:porin family protein [Chitinophagales bacterium]